jgi:hypothetical protein
MGEASDGGHAGGCYAGLHLACLSVASVGRMPFVSLLSGMRAVCRGLASCSRMELFFVVTYP